MTAMTMPPVLEGSSRIPDSLKIIFIQANQGEEIHEPPRDKSAFKVFENPAHSEEETSTKSPSKTERKQRPKLKQGLSRLFGSRTAALSEKASKPTRRLSLLNNNRGPELRRKVDELSSISAHSRPEMPSESQTRKSRRGVRPTKSDDLCSMSASAHARTHMTSAPDMPSARLSKSDEFRCSQPASPDLSTYPSQRSPQVFLDVMLRTRGYALECFNTLETSYMNDPTALQIASFQSRIQSLVRFQDTNALREMMTCGISLNPCSAHGDSLLHTACRNGYDGAVRVMLECGSSVQVSDETGRTPLHSAFFGSTPSFEIVDMILRLDRHLLHLRDRHGATPLSYVPRAHWGTWIDFIYSKRDIYWPRRNKRLDGVCPSGDKMFQKPNSAPLANPTNALPREMVGMVASGKISPEEAQILAEDDESEETGTISTSDSCSLALTNEYSEDGYEDGDWDDQSDSESVTSFTDD